MYQTVCHIYNSDWLLQLFKHLNNLEYKFMTDRNDCSKLFDLWISVDWLTVGKFHLNYNFAHPQSQNRSEYNIVWSMQIYIKFDH